MFSSMRLVPLALLAVTLLPVGLARADSPLTSTRFHVAYRDLALVRQATAGLANDAVLRALLDAKRPTHEKAALIDALGWKLRGQDNAQRFYRALVSAKSIKAPKPADLTAAELFVLGYLRAMDDYLKLTALAPNAPAGSVAALTPEALLALAEKRAPRDFTIALVSALVRAQRSMSTSFCDVYEDVRKTVARFPSSRRKLRRKALAAIQGYVRGYRSYCPQYKPKKDPEFDQIYAITRYQRWIVTGTQAGVVFWEPDSGRIQRRDRSFIAAHFLVHDGKLWVGAHHELRVYRGDQPQVYLRNKNARGIRPYLRGGKLVARRGRTIYRYDAVRDRFVRDSVAPSSAYHWITRKNGERWQVRFLRALVRIGQDGVREEIPYKSARYPGRDPRRLHEDANGQLWVIDFVDGFYRYDAATQRFVHHDVFRHKASAMTVDAQRQRSWFLHYTDGLTLESGGKRRFTDLRALSYMRALYLEPQTGVVWVGGWNQLLRLTYQAHILRRRSYSVVSGVR